MKGSSMGDDVVIFLWMTIFEEKKKVTPFFYQDLSISD